MPETEVPYASNEVRLSPREWAWVVALIAGLVYLVPALWTKIEPFRPGPDYRVPFSLGNDYWIYQRLCQQVCDEQKTLVVGDSVVWGHYVASHQTLSHYLNELAGDDRFANLGVDGIHPAAMAGLVEHYGADLSARNVILHCNLLWMSSPKHDLRTEKEFAFNHPRLVPQFVPRIPCYAESFSGRIGTVLGRNLAFFGWANHLRIAYFHNSDLAAWTIEHPYRNPLRAVTLALPLPDEQPSPEPVAEPWTSKQIPKFNPQWVELAESFQWSSFRRTVEILQRRGNRVFVVVGPFNEHMLTKDGLPTYHRRLDGVKALLEAKRIPHYVSPPLSSELYADASHPLSAGYAALAQGLFDDKAFVAFRRVPR